MGAWFEAIIKKVIPNSRVMEKPVSSQLLQTDQSNVDVEVDVNRNTNVISEDRVNAGDHLSGDDRLTEPSDERETKEVEVDVNKNTKVNAGDHLSGDDRLTEPSDERETKESSCDDAHLYFVQFEGLVTLQQLL